MASRSCDAGLHGDCAAICSCYCHTLPRVKKDRELDVPSNVKTYRLELKSLTSYQAVFAEQKPEKSVDFGNGVLYTTTNTLAATTYGVGGTPLPSTHTWAIGRKEWEELGKPTSITLTVTA